LSGSCVTFSNASIDARNYIARIKGAVKIGMRDLLNIDDFFGGIIPAYLVDYHDVFFR
jgi:hypothetical protein